MAGPSCVRGTLAGMPDFDVRFDSGTTSPVWDDARLSFRALHPHRYRRVVKPTGGTVDVVVKGVVAGVVAPLDGALGGRLFTCTCVQFGGAFPPGVILGAGQTSLITLRFSASSFGHNEFTVRRPDGGTITLSVEVE